MVLVHSNVGLPTTIEDNTLLVYENPSMIVEIDNRGIRRFAKYDNKIINNPNIITIIEEGIKVTISVDGQEFAQVTNFIMSRYGNGSN